MLAVQHNATKTAVAIGIGCKKGCSSEAIVTLVARAMAAASCTGTDARLFTHEAKKSEPGLADAAKALGLPLVFLDGEVLRQASLRAITSSPKVMALYGVAIDRRDGRACRCRACFRLARCADERGGASCAIAGKKRFVTREP